MSPVVPANLGRRRTVRRKVGRSRKKGLRLNGLDELASICFELNLVRSEHNGIGQLLRIPPNPLFRLEDTAVIRLSANSGFKAAVDEKQALHFLLHGK